MKLLIIEVSDIDKKYIKSISPVDTPDKHLGIRLNINTLVLELNEELGIITGSICEINDTTHAVFSDRYFKEALRFCKNTRTKHYVVNSFNIDYDT